MASITREAVVAEAREWIGTPWQHQAFLKQVACDCIGLIGGVPLALGMEGAQEWADDPNLHNYGRNPKPDQLWETCGKFLLRIQISEATRLADILVFSFRIGHLWTGPMHFAIISCENPLRVIHAYTFAKEVIEQSLPLAKAKVVGAYRYKELA